MKATATDVVIEPTRAITEIRFNGRTLIVCSDRECDSYVHFVTEIFTEDKKALVLQDYTTKLETTDYTVAKHFHDNSVASVVDDLEKGKL